MVPSGKGLTLPGQAIANPMTPAAAAVGSTVDVDSATLPIRLAQRTSLWSGPILISIRAASVLLRPRDRDPDRAGQPMMQPIELELPEGITLTVQDRAYIADLVP